MARRPPTGLVAAAVFLGAVAVIVLVVLFRGGDREALTLSVADLDVRGFEEQVAAELEPVTLRPVSALRIRVRQLVWNDAAGRPWLRAPLVSFRLRLDPGGVFLSAGEIRDPVLDLVQYADGSWNYQTVLDPLLERGPAGDNGAAGDGMRIQLGSTTLTGGVVRIRTPEARYAATSLDVRLASALLAGPGVREPRFQIARADALLELPDTAGGTLTREVSLQGADLRLADGALAFQVESGTFGSSTFASATGVWNPDFGGLGVDMEITVTSFRLADVPWLRAEVPEDASGRFHLRVEPAGGDRTAIALSDLELRAPGSAASGSLRVTLGPAGLSLDAIDMRVDSLRTGLIEAFTGPVPYTGRLSGTLQGTGGRIGFDLRARLAATPGGEEFTTDVTGQIALGPEGVSLQDVAVTLDQVPLAALEAMAPGLPLGGFVSGTVRLDGAPSERPVRVDIRLEAGGGIVTVAGMVDLTGAVPAYDVTGRLIGVELRRVLEPAAPPAQVHASFALQGRGTELGTATADVRANGSFTGWRSEPGDTLAVDLSLRAGEVRADEFRVSLGPISATAAGEWRITGGGGGAIRYALMVESLEPLAPYLPPGPTGTPRFARGRIEAEGRLAGTLEAPSLEGVVAARDFRFGQWAAERFSAEYDATFGEGLPIIQAQITGTDLRTPSGDFDAATATLDFTRPTFELALQADQVGGGVLEVEAEGRIEDAGGREILLRRAEVDLEDECWRLASPARVAWTRGEAVLVEDLRVENTAGPGRVRLDGIVAPLDEADFGIDVQALPVGDLLDLVGSEFALEGALSLEGRVAGPTESPVLDLRFALVDGSLQGVRVQSIEATVDYARQALQLTGSALLGDSARVEIDGRIPVDLALGLTPSYELVEGGGMDVRITSTDFPLATLDPGLTMVRNLEGRVRAELRVAGSPGDPELSGSAAITGGALTVPLLEQRYREITGEVVLSGREARVTNLTARSDGTARLSGTLTFDEMTNPLLDLRVDLQQFRVQNAPDADDAALWGGVRISGTARSPTVTGDVRADDGTFDATPFMAQSAFNERLVGVADPLFGAPLDEMALEEPSDGGLVVSNLRFTAGSDLWFATEEARARLRGEMIIDRSGGETAVQGTLTGDQGTFTLQVGVIRRRFEILESNIRFFGSPDPDPALDITASRLIRTADGGDIEVRVQVGGTLSNPTLDLSTPDAATIPDSELLSFLLFGQPSFALGEVGSPLTSGGQILGGSAATLVGVYDYTSIFFEDLLLQDIGLPVDYLQILPGAQLDQPVVTAGVQVTNDGLLLVEYPFGNTERWELRAEYRIDREWSALISNAPVNQFQLINTGADLPIEFGQLQRQWFIEVRRRWTY